MSSPPWMNEPYWALCTDCDWQVEGALKHVRPALNRHRKYEHVRRMPSAWRKKNAFCAIVPLSKERPGGGIFWVHGYGHRRWTYEMRRIEALRIMKSP